MTSASVVPSVAGDGLAQTARGFAVSFQPREYRVSQMRTITAAHMPLWRIPSTLADDILLAVSELLTNAVTHGTGDVELRVLYDGEKVRIEVTDGNPAPAKFRTPGIDEDSGRGLWLVAVLSRDWGISDGGRTTWCVFRVPQERS